MKKFSLLTYLWLVIKNWPQAFFLYPCYTIKLTWQRFLYSIFRTFIGPTFRSSLTGERIFNIQSLISAFAFHIVRELSVGDWEKEIRETPQPWVFDVGSNLGQFSWYVESLNPGARCVTIDAWPAMDVYNAPFDGHYTCAIHDFKDTITLSKSKVGLTASTVGMYDGEGETETVECKRLESIWESERCPEITLLKIDVDGGEVSVILSASKMLEHVKFILVEINSPEALSFFTIRFGPGQTKNGHDYLFRLN